MKDTIFCIWLFSHIPAAIFFMHVQAFYIYLIENRIMEKSVIKYRRLSIWIEIFYRMKGVIPFEYFPDPYRYRYEDRRLDLFDKKRRKYVILFWLTFLNVILNGCLLSYFQLL